MKYKTGNEVRALFLDYFSSKGHMIEPGASLIPNNDPTLLWINAGVAALKKYFDGSEKPKSNRIANAQKSIRTNDIENVGRTARHHTFFEMLGNFSIGDYFKKEAIEFAWEFLTSPNYIGMDIDKMYVSVYADDAEAYRIWIEDIGINPKRILKTKDNFWEIGDGPSGPNSEIFYDRGLAYDSDNVGEKLFFDEIDNDRYIEVWNVVFSQYDAKVGVPRSEYKELPQKNIDTGMGLERLVSIVQNGETNFDTDLFLPIIKEVEKQANVNYTGKHKMAYRVIADHIRTVVFALSDGATFSNTGRGYVLRRVLRRAVRYGIQLGINKAFMYKLVGVVSENMIMFYPYLMDKIEHNERLIKIEEETFHKTLSNGEKLLEDEIKRMNGATFSGKVAFKLYDTYGFPYELTEEILKDKNIIINRNEFDQAMQQQKDRARLARNDIGSMSSQSEDLMNFTLESQFVGYDKQECVAKVIGLFHDGIQVDCLKNKGQVVFDTTCFYAESGGQVADTGGGQLETITFLISDVKKAPHGQFLHTIEGDIELRVGDEVHLEVNKQRRQLVTRNHSATHLLQSALKQVIGEHVTQAGSYVCDEYLRFDFSHFEKVTQKQLDEIEYIVNSYIQKGANVTIEYLDINMAKKSGATAMFDEKYGDVVRVVSMGDVSKEFCGGCHVENISSIGTFKIASEESIGSGVRRIIAKSGLIAYNDFKENEKQLLYIADVLKMKSIQEVSSKVETIQKELSLLQKEMKELTSKALLNEADSLLEKAKQIGDYKVLIEKIDEMDGAVLKELAISLRDKLKKGVVFLATSSEDKVVFVSASTKDMIQHNIKCGDLVKEAAQICGGNGGGRPDLAQAGGKDTSKLNEAVDKIIELLLH